MDRKSKHPTPPSFKWGQGRRNLAVYHGRISTLVYLAVLPQLPALAGMNSSWSKLPSSTLNELSCNSLSAANLLTWRQVCATSFYPVILLNANGTLIAAQFEAAQPPKDAISALVFAPGLSRRLLASSWDKNVYLYEVSNGAEEANLVGSFEHRAPVLDVCFGADENEAFFAGMDHQVKRWVVVSTVVPVIKASMIDTG
jgi:hypothetical protein